MKINQKEEVVLLEERVENFLDWYEGIFTKKTLIGSYLDRKTLSEFIEDFANWYILCKMPDCEVAKKIEFSDVDYLDIENLFFIENPHIKEIKDGFSPENKETIEAFLKKLHWSNFYSYEAFLETLPFSKSVILYDPVFDPEMILLNKNNFIKISNVGIVEEVFFEEEKASIIPLIKGENICDAEIQNIFKKNFGNINNVKKAITLFENSLLLKTKFLEAVMETIIAKGGKNIGPRRGLLFAKEFKLDLSIPMIYGIDRKDIFLSDFIDYYISLGGNLKIIVYVDYFKKKGKSIKRVLKNFSR